jgi:hypothetical protein
MRLGVPFPSARLAERGLRAASTACAEIPMSQETCNAV